MPRLTLLLAVLITFSLLPGEAGAQTPLVEAAKKEGKDGS